MMITAKMSKRARSLLKWNVNDVASRCDLSLTRLESFERNSVRLSRPENKELVKVYVAGGIEFTRDFDVRLNTAKVKKTAKNQQDEVYEVNLKDFQQQQPPAEAENNVLTEEEKRLQEARQAQMPPARGRPNPNVIRQA